MEEDEGNQPVDPPSEEPAEEPAAAPDPERVGRFRILGRLAADGLGVVYQAEDEASQRTIALEVLWADLPEEQVVDEARAVAALAHPNLEVIHEVGEDNGYIYIAMDMAEGQALRALVSEGPVPDAPDLAVQIATGLAYAHAAGIVHGALAPENVFITDDGRVRLVDLALAKFRAAGEASPYAAPEQVAGLEVTAASDVFAFGLVYHEMLTGHLPGPDEPLDPFVAECLATDPAERPDSAALVRAFDAPAAPPARPSSRWRWPLIIGAVVCVLALLGWLTKPEPSITTYTDLPPPRFQNRQAATEYAAALHAMRDDSWNLAQVRLAHVVDLEPSSAAAHLRLAIANHRTIQYDLTAMHAEYTRSIELRNELPERDQLLADALEPVLLRPQEDLRDAEARLAKLHQRWPLDLEILDLLASVSSGDPARQLALADESVRLDPQDGNAHELRGVALEMLDRDDDARKAFEASVAVSVTSTGALRHLEDLDSSEGRCQDLERHARFNADRSLIPDPALLEATIANGGGVEPFHQVLSQMVSEMPAPLARVTEVLGNAQLAFTRGDFAETRRLAMQAEDLIGHDPTLSQSPDLHYRARFLLLREALATGNTSEVTRIAKDTEATSPSTAWVHRLAAGSDPAALAKFQGERDAQAAEALAHKELSPLEAWYLSYASAVFAPADASVALDALPRFGALTQHPSGVRDHLAGRTLYLAGRIDDALPYLRRAVASCMRYRDPWLHAEAAVALGDALASKGDTSAACAAYGKVVAWWGNAKPTATSAQTARAARAKLHCAD